MSSNDFILIQKTKKNYKLTHRDADTNRILVPIATCKSAEKALKLARDYDKKLQEEGFGVEYGIVFKEIKK